jgi:hypothetical protein
MEGIRMGYKRELKTRRQETEADGKKEWNKEKL